MELYIALQAEMERIIPQAKELGVKGILTNASLLQEAFGKGLSEIEQTEKLLELDDEMLVFASINRNGVKEIVETAHKCCSLSPRVGVKIPSSAEGMAAIRILSAEGIRCIATAMFTYGQAYMAAECNAWAISPFIHRGIDSGIDMLQQLKDTRALYDRMDNPPMILAASIRDAEEAETALKCGADSTAITFAVMKQLCSCSLSDETESKWAGTQE
ncbi:MAG: hypothetical protein EOM64_06275 [Erysipelotrichia bacterium]|nr:hypothetical protein [Erysipelotrichia bacterium]